MSFPILMIKITKMVELIPGSVMCHILANLPAPSTDADSYNSLLMAVMAAKKIMAFHPISFHSSAMVTTP